MERVPELDAVLARCCLSLETHCKVFHLDRFSAPFSVTHKELFKHTDCDKRPQKILVTAHRGWGKTSIFNFGLPSQSIIFKKESFIVPVSATSTLAEMQSENLKTELKSKNTVRAVIGDIEQPDNPFSKTLWRTGNGVYVLPRGAGQQIRGIILGHDRPGLIVIDDLEKKDEVQNPDLRKQLKEWFFEDLMGAVDRRKDQWRIIMIGTILHEDSLLANLAADPSWVHLDFPLCTPELETLWPEYKQTEDIKELYEEYKRNGMLGSFYREFMNDPAPIADAPFQQSMFKYYSETEMDLNREAENIVILDPAKSAKVHSAYSAIAGIALHHASSGVYIRECVNKRMYPDEIYDELFSMADRINAKTIGVEVTGLNEFILQPLKNEALMRGRPYEIVELKARKGEGEYSVKERGKEGRIAALAPYYRLGRVFHNPSCCQVLEQQLLAFPHSKYKDMADAVSYVIEMMHLGDRYFEGIGDMGEEGSEEAEFAKLEEEDMPAYEEDEFSCVLW